VLFGEFLFGVERLTITRAGHHRENPELHGKKAYPFQRGKLFCFLLHLFEIVVAKFLVSVQVRGRSG
jgi:hypothetical protein